MTALVKLFEIRDEGTTMPIIAIKPDPHNEVERWLYAKAGYGLTPEDQGTYVMLAPMHGGEGMLCCDPYTHPGAPRVRTLFVAHKLIITNWNVLESGDVVDVQHILGETDVCKQSERG